MSLTRFIWRLLMIQLVGQILKYFAETMAFLLIHECVVETLDVNSMQQLDANTELPITILSEIEMESSSISFFDEMRRFFLNFTFPIQLDELVEVLDMDITTVCKFSDSGSKCGCEDQYFWPYEKCTEYGSCDGITNNTCSCINDFPSDGQFCQPVNKITTIPVLFEYLSEIQIDAENTAIIDQLMNYWKSSDFLYIINDSTNITEINITTVCFFNETQHQCKCDDPFVWPNDTCHSYETCDEIIDGSCTCINALPVDGQFCQLKEVPKLTKPSTTSTPPSSSPTTTPSSTSTPTPPLALSPSTPSPTTKPSSTSTPTPSPPSPSSISMTTTVIGMSITITRIFDTNLTDPASKNYEKLSTQIETAIDTGYSKMLNGYISRSAKVSGFRSGSVIADYTINATSNNLDFKAANTLVSYSLRTQGINLTEDSFAQSDQKDFITDQLYPMQKLDLNCSQPDFAKGPIKWMVTVNGDNKDPALDNTRYILSNNNSTLTVKNASESDSGRYSCIMQSKTVPYIQWQNIVIMQRPHIIVGENYHYFPCEDSIVQLRCTIDAGNDIEWVLNDAVQTSGPDSIILNYITKSGNCKEETFTCRFKGLRQLQNYSYSWSRVTVSLKTRTQEYTCENVELGFGKTNDEKKGICGNGMKGTITYRCDSLGWMKVQDNCVLNEIDKIKSNAKSLLVEEIPEFMANLSSVTAQNNVNIAQSPATVQAVVDILVIIANLSQSIVINEPVMKDFLNTVDILISGNASNQWSMLNNNNNTSIQLLSAIENISDRLTDDFAINGTSIQLNRTTVKNSFSLTSTLPNSTTEIVIPQIPTLTTITIIIFTTLDNVLPTRNTSNKKDTNNSAVRINGDVIVVKVKPPLHNISFAFDITDQSLGNPQCVFWNFNLDAWDSNGCKVKPPGHETGKITCECNHTTSFSVLMSPFHIDNKALAYITYTGVAISMASLILCLIIEIIVWKSMTRNDTSYMRHVSLVNIAVSLLIANICFIIGAAVAEQEQPTSVGRCSPAVFFMHFFYLALFFWMLISALFLFYRTVMVLSQMSRTNMMVIAFTVGYAAPLLIAVITVASTAGPQKYITKQDACWLNWDESQALLAFVIPALTIVAINLVVLTVVLYKMLRRGVGATAQPDEKHALVIIARCVAILTPIFGLTWGFGIGTMVSREFGIHVVFALLNSLQGLFILVFGTLLDRKVRESLHGKLSLQKLSSNRTNNTSAGSSSTPGLNFFPRIRRRNVYNVSEANLSSAVTSSDNSNGSYAIMNT